MKIDASRGRICIADSVCFGTYEINEAGNSIIVTMEKGQKQTLEERLRYAYINGSTIAFTPYVDYFEEDDID